MAPDDDPKVKDLLDGKLEQVVDEATRRELERWFGLPSFQQLSDEGKPFPEDPEIAAVREQREKAIAAVDPALLDSIAFRTEANPETLLQMKATVAVHVRDIALFDQRMVQQRQVIAEPREVEIPEELRDDMKDRAPQALLRDLHRPENYFDKQFELIDFGAEQRLDIVAEVKAAMATSWKLPPLSQLPGAEGRAIVTALRAYRRQPWPDLFAEQTLPNRRIEP